jgi:hypothetical protein
MYFLIYVEYGNQGADRVGSSGSSKGESSQASPNMRSLLVILD